MKALRFLIVLIVRVQAELRLDPLVHTNAGLIRGLNANDGDYSMFLGIPYAQVNHTNVFGDAIPISKFDDVFEAFDDTSMCPQIEDTNNTISGTLDCLHLNIYVPNIASSKNPLPVSVWIHGGFLNKGHGSRYMYGPKFLIKHNIIFVTMNYRLGPYGFMCLDIPEIPGNQGLKDQYLAIRWISENIKEFGGDPSRITLMGQSAGSKCVEAHLLSRRKNMFNKVIMQSGSILGPNVVDLANTNALVNLAQYLGFVSNDTKSIIQFLSTSNTDLIIGATKDLGLQFQMCVEREFENVNRFIHEHPAHSSYAETNNVSILAGFNSKEVMIESTKPGVFENPDYIKNTLNNLFLLEENEEVIDFVTHFYIGDEFNSNTTMNLIDFISDFTYNYPIQRSIELFLNNNANVYQYLFSYDSKRNMMKKKANLTLPGAAHSDELAFLFDLSYDKEINEIDQMIIDRLTGYWTNFVKYGDPTPQSSKQMSTKWVRASKEKLYYMNIDSVPSIGTRAFHDRLTFWKLFFKTNEEKYKPNLYFRR